MADARVPGAPLVCPVCRYARPFRFYYGGQTWLCKSCDFPNDPSLTLRQWRERLNVKLGRAADWKHYGA